MDPQAAKQQIVEKVKEANNVLVTVSRNPSVDQLASAIGLTLMMNKMGKHGAAVVSGEIPPALQFLEPDKTIDSGIDSLRDFVISLSKDKADKLRYKVENDVVKIFITPYKTKLKQEDFEFTQGDFNVDVVIALGVESRDELDEAIKSHGRILHDATVITISSNNPSNLGAIDWTVPDASSLSEMLVSISEAFQGGILDAAMSTAFLTGIVAETERFRNSNTTPKVMTMAAQLMAAGANQQLVASNLDMDSRGKELSPDVSVDTSDSAAKSTVEFSHDEKEEKTKDNQGAQSEETPLASVASEDQTLEDLEKQLETLAGDSGIQEASKDKSTNLPPVTVTEEEAFSGSIPKLEDLPGMSEAGAKSDALPVEEPSPSLIPTDEPGEQAGKMPILPPEKEQTTGGNSGAPTPLPAQDGFSSNSMIKDSKGSSPRQLQVEPVLGGTFNATTKQAEENKKLESEMSINNAILSHNAPPTEEAGNMSNKPVTLGGSDAPAISTSPQPLKAPELDLDEARRAVEEASSAGMPNVANNPLQSLNAQQLGDSDQVQFSGQNPVPPPPPQGVPAPVNGAAFGAQPQQQFNVPPPVPQNGPAPLGLPPNSAPPITGPAPQFPGAPPQQMTPPPMPPSTSPVAPPPPPAGPELQSDAPRVSPSSLGSFAPTPQPTQAPQPTPGAVPPPANTPYPPLPPQNGATPPPPPIQFDATPPPGNYPS